MKKIIVALMVLCIFTFCSANLMQARADAKADWEQLKAELQKGGFSPKELKWTERSSKEMIEQGATKEQLKKTFLDLKNKGVGDRDLKKTADSMKDLIKAGETPKEAGNIVSAAAHNAKAQGLKGKELAAKVHQAVRERKAQKDALKKAKKEGKQTKRQWWQLGQEKEQEQERDRERKNKAKAKDLENEVESTAGKGKGKGKEK